MLFFCFCAVISLQLASGKNLPPAIKKCKKSDPNFNKCMSVAAVESVKIFAEGDRELGLVRLEPFYVERLELGNSSDGAVSLSQLYQNVYLHGVTNSTVENLDANFSGDSCYWRFNAITPVLRMDADYKLSGHVLIFPINGHGKCTNTLYDLNVYHSMKCERYKKRNKTHLRITDYQLKMNPKRVIFDFENVVDGNEQLSKEVAKTVNENALLVYADIKDGFERSFSLIYSTVINSFFDKVPEEKLFD